MWIHGAHVTPSSTSGVDRAERGSKGGSRDEPSFGEDAVSADDCRRGLRCDVTSVAAECLRGGRWGLGGFWLLSMPSSDGAEVALLHFDEVTLAHLDGGEFGTLASDSVAHFDELLLALLGELSVFANDSVVHFDELLLALLGGGELGRLNGFSVAQLEDCLSSVLGAL